MENKVEINSVMIKIDEIDGKILLTFMYKENCIGTLEIYKPTCNGICEISTIYIQKEYQQQGLCGLLYKKSIEYLHNNYNTQIKGFSSRLGTELTENTRKVWEKLKENGDSNFFAGEERYGYLIMNIKK